MDHISCQKPFGETRSLSLYFIRKVLVRNDLEIQPAVVCLIIGQVCPDNNRIKVFQA